MAYVKIGENKILGLYKGEASVKKLISNNERPIILPNKDGLFLSCFLNIKGRFLDGYLEGECEITFKTKKLHSILVNFGT